MKLYHGTRSTLLPTILRRGLMPRGKRRSNWAHAPSHADAVYLTDAYAPYFAAIAASEHNESQALVIEIDADKLDAASLLPDEDACEEINRDHDQNLGLPNDMHKRVAYYRARLHRYGGDQWKTSLKALGTCCHMGRIPPEVITRVALIPRSYLLLWDAQITLANYRILGERYRAQTARLFGDEAVIPRGPFADDWQVAMKHTVHNIIDSRLGVPRQIEHQDERRTSAMLAEMMKERT